MYAIKQSTAITVPFFVHDANGDAVTGLTNASFAKRISKNGGAFAAMTVTISELENGWYTIPLTATHSDTNGLLSIAFTNAGAKQVNLQWRVETRIADDLAWPTTTGRSLDVLATGEVGVDFDNVNGTLDAGEIGAAALTAAKFGAGAIDANALATDAVNEIVDQVWNEAIEDHDTQGNMGWAMALAVYSGSEGPGIYIDSNAANTNTVVGTDGTEINPVSTFVAARTLADALGLKIYYLEGNSDITLAATHTDWEFIGIGSISDNIINLGSQDVSRSLFRNVTIEGTQGGASRITARDCALQDPGAGDTTLHIFAERCGIVDRIQVDTSADNVFDQCYSLVAGTSAPIIQATGAAGTIGVRHYSGGIEFESLSASHNLSIEGMGQIIFNVSCNVNANVSARGVFTITDNTAGMASFTETAVVNQDTIADAVWDELFAGHVGVGSFGEEVQTHATSAEVAGVQSDTDDIQTRLPAALVGGRIDASVGAMAAGVLTNAAIAANAISDAELAADAFDGLFIRDVDQVEAGAPLHSFVTALLKAVSRVRDNAGTMEIYRTDAVTLHASQTITVDATLDPMDELGAAF